MPIYPSGGSVSSSHRLHGSDTSSRFGSGSSTLLHGDEWNRYGGSSSLSSYMSESERLARLQSQGVHSGSLSGSSLIENSDIHGRFGDGDSSSGSGNGYLRTKSWESSSKWGSGTEYGSDGKPKSYGYLSTAESEDHNINGQHTGYKAATTTLDDDGKVSTYSIHTP